MKQPVPEPGQPWTVCPAPSNVLVVDGTGSVRTCDYGACAFKSGKGGLAALWNGADFGQLRSRLEASAMPLPNCRSCVEWLRDDLAEAAPPLRDYGHLPLANGTGRPRVLVIQLPERRPPAARLVGALRSLLVGLETFVVEGTAAAVAAAVPLFDELRAAENRPGLSLRLRGAADFGGVAAAVAGLVVREIEFTAASHAEAPIAAAKALAEAVGGSLRVRFVFAPDNWFEFEDLARTCAALGVSIDLRLLDRGGAVPLAALSLEDLRFVKDVVGGLWQRCGGPGRPTSIAEQGFDRLSHELRQLLRRHAEVTLANGGEPRATARLTLPPTDHPWSVDESRRSWWWATLLGRGHLDLVRGWVTNAAAGEAGERAARDLPWLRQLVQRTAAETRNPQLLDLLRRLYAAEGAGKVLAGADQQFAAQLDLTQFGGPWSGQLGLAEAGDRARPFDIGPARKQKRSGSPDLTVLVPSYRHEAYIEETLRSVLAQRYTNYRLLVVDDRSPDATVERARSVVDPRVEVRVNPKNVGLGNSVLQALEWIDTPYVALLNSDDLFHPDRLGRCRDVLEERPDVQLVTTAIQLVDQRGGELTPANASLVHDGRQVFDWVHWFDRSTPPSDLPQEGMFAALLERNFLVTSSNLVARTSWLRAQAEALRSLKYCLDWQLFLEAALQGALHHLHEPLIAYRLHATNTVWFREGGRWSYFLEVNRVAAAALRRYAANGAGGKEARVEAVVDAVAQHLAKNGETDGFALFLNTALDALQLDRTTENSPRVQELVQALNQRAEQIRAAGDRREETPAEIASAGSRSLLGELGQEEAQIERDQRRWLQGYVDTLESRLRDSWTARDRLDQEKGNLAGQRAELDRRVQQLLAETKKLEEQRNSLQRSDQTSREQVGALELRVEGLTRDLVGVRGDLETARGAAAAISELRDLIATDLRAARAARDNTVAEHGRLRDEHDRLHDEHQRLGAERDTLAAEHRLLTEEHDELCRARDRLDAAHVKLAAEMEVMRQLLAREQAAKAGAEGQLAAAVQANTDLRAQRSELEAALAREVTHVNTVAEAKLKLEHQRNELVHQVAKLHDEMQALRRTREFRTGNFFWNKMPFGYLSRRGKKWYRRLLDARSRAAMWGSKLLRRQHRADGVAVVAACWQWPIYSHTFVYQEMLGLTHMGLDVRLFHWDLGDASQQHSAFRYLYEHRTQLQPIWENHQKDKEHFEKTKPGRLRSFLERVAAATGRTVEDLEKEPLVVQGCTFARMAELAGARYLHSYFFYDQSFMTMQAAWMLDLPRGVSCYADHMMDDYPFKLVPLHVELATVVVATSARIKRELSEKTGGKYDDKIIVKPNGVDGARFPAVDRSPRKQPDPFEVVSISRIEPKKGLIHLVEAIAELKKRGRRVIAHVIGSKDPHSKGSLEYAAEFEQRIAELGVGDQIVMHGMMKQEQLAPILQKSRAFVAPYVETASGDKDGIPTAMLEALASKLPVVTTDSGSILEVIDDGVEGFVVPQRDSMAFAAALQRLIDDPALERRMANAARARFDRDFDIRVTEKRLHERVAASLAAKLRAR